MKKIISVLVAMLMILSSVSAFAAVAVDTAYPSKAYFNDLSSVADGAAITASGSPFSVNASYPISSAFSGGQFSFQHTDATKSGLVYLNFGSSHEYDNYAFGYDVKFSGITSNRGDAVYSNSPGILSTVFQDSAQEKIDSGAWVVGTKNTNIAYLPGEADTGTAKAYKTAWCFRKSGDEITFTTRKADGALVNGTNGKPAIFFGSAQLEQDTFYTVKVFVDNVNKTYKAIIVNPDGTYQETGIDGKIQNAFYGLNKIDSQISVGVNTETTVTLDNLFVTNTVFDLRALSESMVSDNGTIDVYATIPNDASNTVLYINGTLVEELTLVPTAAFNDYKITAALPEGTALGNTAVVELRATINGVQVSKSVNTELLKTYSIRKNEFNKPTSTTSPAGLRRIQNAASPAVVEGVDGDANGAWAFLSGEVDFTSMAIPMKGIVEFSFDFKSAEIINAIRLRLTANTSKGTGFNWHGNKDSSSDPYEHFINGYPQNLLPKVNEWNHLLVRADFYQHYYWVYLNDEIIEEDIFTDTDEGTEGTTIDNWTDRVADARLIMSSSISGTPMYIDNIKFEELRVTSRLAAPTATVKYASGDSALYEGTALDAIDVTGFDFATPVAFDAASINSENVKIVNSAGEVVPATFSFANGVISAAYEGYALPTDDYKLVVGKNATIVGKALGAAYEVPFALNSDDKVLDLDANAAVTDKVNLKVFAANANKVVFKVNDNTVRTFAAPEADSLYEFLYAPSVVGKNIFDAYIYTDDGVNVVSSSFYYLVDAQMLQQSNAVESALTPAAAAKGELIAGAGHDGSKAYKLISLEGTPDEPAKDPASNSNTSSFTPGNGLYRKMYTEFEIMPGEDTNVATEIGFNLAGVTYGANSAAYRTLNPRGSSPSLFNSAGKILGTTTAFVPGTWYKCCQLIDFDKMTCEWWIYTGDNYETLVVSTKDDISNIGSSAADKYPNWKKDIVITYKYKICLHPNNKNSVAATETKPLTPAWIMLDNFKRWHPVEIPSVASVTANGAAIKNDVIAKGTDAITVTMDKDFHALSADKIAVTVDGAAVGTVTPIDKKSFTVSGLAGVAEGKKINIKLLKGLSVPYNNNTAAVQADFSFDIFVGDANAICLYPLSVATESGNDLIAFAKYINGSANDLNTYFIMTEYEDDAKARVRQTNFAHVTVEAGKVGAVSGYLTGIIKAEGCQVMLWNTDFAPLLDSVNGQ